jgi:hypothetical protein
MALSPAQYTALKNDIAADGTLGQLAHNGDNGFTIAAAYNLPASPAVNVWRSDARVKDIFDSVSWDVYTPKDAVPTADALSNAIFQSRLLVIQTKQMNLQNILTGRDVLDCTKANIRAGLRDAVIALPAGVSGAQTSAGGAGGATVLNACVRNATRAEALFVTGTANTGSVTASLMGFEGSLTYNDIIQAWNS